MDKYIAIMRTIAEKMNVPLADVRAECKKYDRYNFLKTFKNSTKDDGVHPGAYGAKIYELVIAECLENLLK